MRILHTADWHLGQKFKQRLDRIEEHRHVTDWLLRLIEDEGIDLLLVAGDVFDTPNPPNNARELYYQFLVQASRLCRHIVITGGNHDSPAMLNAPREILHAIRVHVVGCATNDIEDEIIILRNPDGKPEAAVAAVPFLRDRDLKSSVAGEGGEERIDRIKAGIKEHYQLAADAMRHLEGEGIPLIATGHLYAKGATASDKQDNIYIGDMENIAADDFPDLFDYVALGHLHKPQMVGKLARIRYSGSLIPMSFGEWKDDKSVTIIEMQGREIKEVKEVKCPLSRKLVSVKGSTDLDIEQQLAAIVDDIEEAGQGLEAWVEILIESEKTRADAFTYFSELMKGQPVRVLRVSYSRTYQAADALSVEYELDHLQPLDIFQKRCESAGLSDEETAKHSLTFRELMGWMGEREG